LWHDARTDPKLRTLTDFEFRMWFNLLLYSSEQEERGVVSLTDKDEVCLQIGLLYEGGDDGCGDANTDALDSIVKVLVRRRLAVLDDGSLVFPAFVERQYENPSDRPEAVRERKRKQREKERDDNTSHEDVTTCHDKSRTETEEETEEETEKKRSAREEIGGIAMQTTDLPPCLSSALEVTKPVRYSGTCYGYIADAMQRQFGTIPSHADLATLKTAIRDGCIPGCDGSHPQDCALQIAWKLAQKGKTRFATSSLWLKTIREDRMEVRQK
jgi:hypothetical protein